MKIATAVIAFATSKYTSIVIWHFTIVKHPPVKPRAPQAINLRVFCSRPLPGAIYPLWPQRIEADRLVWKVALVLRSCVRGPSLVEGLGVLSSHTTDRTFQSFCPLAGVSISDIGCATTLPGRDPDYLLGIPRYCYSLLLRVDYTYFFKDNGGAKRSPYNKRSKR